MNAIDYRMFVQHERKRARKKRKRKKISRKEKQNQRVEILKLHNDNILSRREILNLFGFSLKTSINDTFLRMQGYVVKIKHGYYKIKVSPNRLPSKKWPSEP